MELYGKWQLEPLCLPHAVNGIVPKVKKSNVVSVLVYIASMESV